MTPILWTLLVGCSGGSLFGGGEPPEPTDTFPSFYGSVPQNLIVLSIDTFRVDHMGRYGDSRGLTPFLDARLAEGVVLDNHQSCSNWTYPGVQCAMDGYDAVDLGMMPSFSRDPVPDRPTGATYFGDAGYTTVMVTSNGWLYDPDDDNDNVTNTNITHGFDHFEHPGSDNAFKVYEAARNALLDRVDENRDPWMMHFHIKEPHTPYNPPDKYLEGLEDLPPIAYDLTVFNEHYDATSEWEDLEDDERELLLQHLTLRYAGEMAYLDDQIERIWGDMETRGLLDDALVLIWSDHGEQFFEHGRQAHALSLYLEENGALGAFWAKNIVPDAVTLPTTHKDLLPTAMEVMGIPYPDDVTGTPASQLAAGRPIHSYSRARLGVVQALRVDDLRLLYSWNSGEKHLYDLSTDPDEQVDLYDPADPRVAEMWETLLPLTEAIDLIVDDTPLEPGP